MLTVRSLREVHHFSIYPEEMKMESHLYPSRILDGRTQNCLWGSQDFYDIMRKSSALHPARISPVNYFTAFDVSEASLIPGPEEWMKMRLIPASKRLLAVWEVFLIYKAHRMGYRNVLIEDEDSVNTFYAIDGLVQICLDIECDYNADKVDAWRINARAIGDDNFMPSTQRIFVGN